MQSNKAIKIFLIKFFGTYLLLFLAYAFYLGKTQHNFNVFSCAPITKQVAYQSEWLLDKLGYNAEISQSNKELSMNLIISDKPIARVVEGCNSISVIILFIAFIVAFSAKFKTTAIYILAGSLLIYMINIIRIAVIAIAIYKFPEYESVLHEIVFPIIIYGTTFLLWFICIQRFSVHKK